MKIIGEVKAGLVYLANSRTVKATERDPVFKKPLAKNKDRNSVEPGLVVHTLYSGGRDGRAMHESKASLDNLVSKPKKSKRQKRKSNGVGCATMSLMTHSYNPSLP